MNLDEFQIDSYSVGHLPIVRAIIDKLGLFDVIDHHRPKHELSRVSDAQCVGAMVLNILSGRVALYRMDWWLQHTDIELLLGEGALPDAFNDTRLASALDGLDEAGTDRILFDVVRRYLANPDRPTVYSVHTDTTSISLYGAYEGHDDEAQVVHGFSKAKRPDLKQLIFGLSLHGAVGIPLLATVMSGNTADSAVNRDHLARLAKLLPNTDDVTIVADCKLVDRDTLGRVLGAGFHVVSLLPSTFSIRRELLERAWADEPNAETWPELERHPGRTKSAPQRIYRGKSYVEPFEVHLRVGADPNNEANSSMEPMRFVVLHSSTKAAAFEKSLPKKLEKDRHALDTFNAKRGAEGFACAEDAQNEAAKLLKRVKLHQADIQVERKKVTLPRARRGRPRAGEEAPSKVVWTAKLNIQPDESAIGRLRRDKSCFVLVTDELEDHKSDAEVLGAYRRQHLVENHCGFRWMKSEAKVSPMFLKTPGRIRAFGLVLILALTVRNYIQFTLRQKLKDNGEKLPHPFTKKPESKLTTEMAMAWFGEAYILHIRGPDGILTRRAPELQAPARRIAELPGVSLLVFSRVSPDG